MGLFFVCVCCIIISGSLSQHSFFFFHFFFSPAAIRFLEQFFPRIDRDDTFSITDERILSPLESSTSEIPDREITDQSTLDEARHDSRESCELLNQSDESILN